MHPQLMARAAAQYGVFTSAQAAEVGYDATQTRARVRSGAWVRLRRGVLTTREHLAVVADDPRAEHLLRAAAGLLVLSNPTWLSHRSAALLHGLPLVGRPPVEVAMTTERQHRRRVDGLELHTARTPPRHRTEVAGLPVTTPARTVSDLARSLPFGPAVVAADAALHDGACASGDLEAVVRDCWVWPGIARTKRVLAFADRRSESPGESLSRVAIAAAGLPAPELQVELLLRGRRMRVDFMWPGRRLVGEFDGRLKYGRADDLWDEKQREDLLRREGYRVARWTWADVHPDSRGMVRILSDALRA